MRKCKLDKKIESSQLRRIKYLGREHSDFHDELRRRVEYYFEGCSHYANMHMAIKCVFWAVIYAGSYLLILFGTFGSAWERLPWVASMGVATVALVLNVGHDASHNALSSVPWVNRLFAKAFDLVGISSYMWHITHDRSHHGFLNIQGSDDGLDSSYPYLRRSPQYERKPYHRYQHIYAFPAYSLYTLVWITFKDFVWFRSRFIGHLANGPHPLSAYVKLLIFKVTYFGYTLGLPLLVLEIPWYTVIIGFVFLHLVAGFYVALGFQPNHAVEGLRTADRDLEGNVTKSWVLHVMESTSDYGTQSWLLNWLYGGLNTHIAHHLFPDVCNIHYPHISRIVRDTAREFGVSYIEHSGLWTAVREHLHYLKKLGRPNSDSIPSIIES